MCWLLLTILQNARWFYTLVLIGLVIIMLVNQWYKFNLSGLKCGKTSLIANLATIKKAFVSKLNPPHETGKNSLVSPIRHCDRCGGTTI